MIASRLLLASLSVCFLCATGLSVRAADGVAPARAGGYGGASGYGGSAAGNGAEGVPAGKSDLSAAEDNVRKTMARLRQEFEQSPDFSAAMEERKAAVAEFDAARKVLVEKLKQTPAYNNAVAEQRKAQDEVDKLRSQPGTPKLVEAATKAMQAGSVITKMEGEAIAKDEKASQARKRMTQASAKVAKMQREFQESLRNHPDIEAAKKDVESTRERVRTAAQEAAASRQRDMEQAREREMMDRQREAEARDRDRERDRERERDDRRRDAGQGNNPPLPRGNGADRGGAPGGGGDAPAGAGGR